MATILITGIGGPAGSSLARQLTERGHTIVGTDMRPVEMASVITHCVPAAREPAFGAILRALAESHGVDLIIPTVSEELPILANETAWPAPIAVAPARGVALANDKWTTWEQLTALGVAVPRALLPTHITSAEQVAATVGWPCITKPRVGRGGRDVAIREASDYFALRALDSRWIIQEFIPGEEYAPNVFLGDNGQDIAVVLRKTALKQGVVGNALSVVRDDAPDVALLAVSAARALGLRGAVDIDIRRRTDGTPVVLEINARFGANSAHAPEVLSALLAQRGL